MSNISIQGSASGIGTIVVNAPATDNNVTVTLPAANTALVGTDTTQTLTNKTIGTGSDWAGNAIPVANGGTGATTSVGALQALGVLGSNTAVKTTDYTVVAADRGVSLLINGTITLTLTAAATLANGFSFAVINTGSGIVTIDPDTTEQIDGAATKTIAAGQSCIVICDGTSFRTLGLSSTGSGGGAVGGGSDKVFYENDMTISASYTLTANKNAMTAGPVTIANGATVTVPDGAAWTIV